MEKTNLSSSRLNFGITLVISFVLFNSSFVIDQAARWSNHLQGAKNGITHIIVYAVLWFIFALPWALAVFAIFRWRRWKRFRTPIALLPAFLALGGVLLSLVISPPTPQRRFEAFTPSKLPQNVQNLRANYFGGGFVDYTDTYFFETTNDEIERLISDLELEPHTAYSRNYSPIKQIEGWPDFKDWKGKEFYSGWDDDEHWFYYLLREESGTKVYLVVGCI